MAPAEAPGGMALVEGRPYTDLVGLHEGWGATWAGQNRSQWFHIAVPTPPRDSSRTLVARRAFVLGRSDTTAGRRAYIGNMTFWDGGSLMWPKSQGLIQGDFSQIGPNNTATIQGDPEVTHGLGVSFLVTYSAQISPMSIYAVGADFEI